MIKIFVSIMLLLAHGYTIEYNHVPMAESGYFTCYNRHGECVADDLELSTLVLVAEIELDEPKPITSGKELASTPQANQVYHRHTAD